MPASYSPLLNEENIKESIYNKQIRYCFYLLTFCVALITLFNILIFYEFSKLLITLENNPALKGLENIKTDEVNTALEVFRAIPLKQIKSIFASINYNEMKQFFEALENCIFNECYRI